MENLDSIDKKYNNFLKVYQGLRNSLTIVKKQDVIESNLKEVVLSGTIKQFELTYETAWKFLKEYLHQMYGPVVTSPRAVFRTCYEYKILSEKVTEGLLDLVDERNLTVHVYDIATAERICNTIENYFFVFEEIAKIKK
ncbi:hypothetical protein BH09DEP1_BH09DEP1_3390 [soil metagenome]